MRKNCSSDREKLLKFEAEGREFANFLRSLEQFIQTMKGQNNFWQQNAFLTCSWRFLIIAIQIGKKYWDLETYRKRPFFFKYQRRIRKDIHNSCFSPLLSYTHSDISIIAKQEHNYISKCVCEAPLTMESGIRS